MVAQKLSPLCQHVEGNCGVRTPDQPGTPSTKVYEKCLRCFKEINTLVSLHTAQEAGALVGSKGMLWYADCSKQVLTMTVNCSGSELYPQEMEDAQKRETQQIVQQVYSRFVAALPTGAYRD